MKTEGYVILNYGEFYAFALDKEHALNIISGTWANKTKFEIVKGNLEYERKEAKP